MLLAQAWHCIFPSFQQRHKSALSEKHPNMLQGLQEDEEVDQDGKIWKRKENGREKEGKSVLLRLFRN